MADDFKYDGGTYLMNVFSPLRDIVEENKRPVHLIPTLCMEDEYDDIDTWLEFKIGYDRLYVLKNIRDFVRTINKGEIYTFGKFLQLGPLDMAFDDPVAKALWQMVREAVAENDNLLSYRARRNYGYGYDYDYGYSSYEDNYVFSGKKFRLTDSLLERFLKIMGDREFKSFFDNFEYKTQVTPGMPEVKFCIKPARRYAHISLKGADKLHSLTSNGAYFFDSATGKLHALDPTQAKKYQELFAAFYEDDVLKLPNDQLGRFFSETMPELERFITVDVDPAFEKRFLTLDLMAEIRLDYYGDGVEAAITYKYGDMEFNPLKADAPEQSKRDKRLLVQDKAKELCVLTTFAVYGFEEHLGHFVQPDEEKAYEFLSEGIPKLAELPFVDIYYAEAFGGKPVSSFKRTTVGVSIGDTNLLKLDFNMSQYDFDDLVDILGSYRQKRRYHRLKDGHFLSLEEQQIAALAELLEEVDVAKVKSSGNTIELPLSKAMYVDSLGREAEGLRLERDSRFKRLARSIANPDTIDAEVPASLQRVLRDYQVTGFSWLEALSRYGLGGILADDMGLGKTLQTLAFILYKKEQGVLKEPVLIVAPTSLIYNWQDELKRFTPQLKAVVVAGTAKLRHEELANAFGEVLRPESEEKVNISNNIDDDTVAEIDAEDSLSDDDGITVAEVDAEDAMVNTEDEDIAGAISEANAASGNTAFPTADAIADNISAGSKAEPVDMVITTYHMLRRDIAEYEKHHFSYCFLDEAQHIKNPTTQLAKAVKRIRCGGCFALTGTPIENNLTELWSVFDFLMPGFLYGHKKFRQQYELPIVRAEDKVARARLARNIAPFVLRRMKKDVLNELPDKVESRMMNEMTPEQKKVYIAYFARAQKDLRKELAAHGFKDSQIKILALLTRLRQIACDPSLFLEDYTGGSGKLDMLEEVLGDAVEAGHRILLFSQFTGMLGNIAKRLDGLSMEYLYLDGSTSAKERMRLVNAFNKGKVPVFLISLKAGGTGLNLTGADMVIHYDPWWNPAVEDQATDRAYRIGQQKNVQVLRLVTKDTIEEKIYALQEKKRALIDQLIKPGETFLSSLSEDEILDLFR